MRRKRQNKGSRYPLLLRCFLISNSFVKSFSSFHFISVPIARSYTKSPEYPTSSRYTYVLSSTAFSKYSFSENSKMSLNPGLGSLDGRYSMRRSVRCLSAPASRSVIRSDRPTWFLKTVSQNSGTAAGIVDAGTSSGFSSGSSLAD